MKTFQRCVLFSLALLLTIGTTLNAQENDRVIIIQKNNGPEKTIRNIDDLEKVLVDFDINIEINEDDQKVKDFMHGRKSHRSSKPYLGVYSSNNENGAGIVLDRVVHNTAASKAGLQQGDIITSVEGNAINSVRNLIVELKQYQVGDVVTIEYIRNNQKAQMDVELGSKYTRRSYSYTYDNHSKVNVDPCKVFIGVYSSSHYNEKGVKITGVIDNTPAHEAKLLKGDYIIAIDGIKVHSHNELLVERNKHNPGDRFLVTYTRGGVEYDVTATFQDCPEPTVKEQPQQIIEEEIEETPIVEVPVVTQPSDNTLKVEGLDAFPNPTYGDVTLKFKAEAKPTTVRIVDIQGRLIFDETLNNFDGNYYRELDVSNGTTGVLTITILQDGKVFTKNIVLLARA